MKSVPPCGSGGSRSQLCNERSVEKAIDCVLNGQQDDLPDLMIEQLRTETRPLPKL